MTKIKNLIRLLFFVVKFILNGNIIFKKALLLTLSSDKKSEKKTKNNWMQNSQPLLCFRYSYTKKKENMGVSEMVKWCLFLLHYLGSHVAAECEFLKNVMLMFTCCHLVSVIRYGPIEECQMS